jgi:hypothetical protein
MAVSLLVESYRISARSASGVRPVLTAPGPPPRLHAVRPPRQPAFTELPEPAHDGIATTDGRRVELDVERLSIEQRQGLLCAIVSYGGLVEEKQAPPDEPVG